MCTFVVLSKCTLSLGEGRMTHGKKLWVILVVGCAIVFGGSIEIGLQKHFFIGGAIVALFSAFSCLFYDSWEHKGAAIFNGLIGAAVVTVMVKTGASSDAAYGVGLVVIVLMFLVRVIPAKAKVRNVVHAKL